MNERVNGLEALAEVIRSNVSREAVIRRMLAMDCKVSALLRYMKRLGLLEEFYTKYPSYREELEMVRVSITPGGN